MTSALKRKATSDSRSISPPAVRRRVSRPTEGEISQKIGDNTQKILTFYSWNVNGIPPLLQKQISFSKPSTFPLRAFLRDHGWPHVLCLQEVKVALSDEVTQRRIESAANSGANANEPTYTTSFSLPRDKHNAIGFGGKVYGVASLLRDDLPPSTTTRPVFDLEGRLLVHTFDDLKLTVVNGYWVNGTSNDYRDPDSGEISGTRHDHKLRFHQHIMGLSKDSESRGYSVILLGDMNVAPKYIDGHPNLRTSPIQHVKNRADFNAKFLDKDNQDGLGAIDLFRKFHGEEKKYTYRGRGRPWGERADRVDLIIASNGLVEAGTITDSDICDNPKDRGHSDHVPLWVSIDTTKLMTMAAASTKNDPS